MKSFVLLASLLAAPLALAHEYAVGELEIAHPYAIATVGNAPVGGGYMEIANAGAGDDTLLSVAVAPEFAGMVQLHEMQMQDGVMLMDEVDGGIPVPAGTTVALEPGGLHVMFMRLPAGLEDGARIPATLNFEKAGEVEVVFNVEARGAGGGDHSGHGD